MLMMIVEYLEMIKYRVSTYGRWCTQVQRNSHQRPRLKLLLLMYLLVHKTPIPEGWWVSWRRREALRPPANSPVLPEQTQSYSVPNALLLCCSQPLKQEYLSKMHRSFCCVNSLNKKDLWMPCFFGRYWSRGRLFYAWLFMTVGMNQWNIRLPYTLCFIDPPRQWSASTQMSQMLCKLVKQDHR